MSKSKSNPYGPGNKDPISIFTSRVKLTFFIIIPLIALLVYGLIYIPMRSALRDSLISNFSDNAHTNYHVIESNIHRALEGARSLSSRTMIKAAIKDYLDGEISLEDLIEYTDGKYQDGAKELNNVIYAERLVKNISIAKYGSLYDGFIYPNINLSSLIEPVVLFTITQHDINLAVIISPIIIEKTTVGYDIAIYSLEEQLDELCINNYYVDLINKEEYNRLRKDSKPMVGKDNMVLVETEDSFLSVFKIGLNFFYTSQNKGDLFAPLHSLVSHILIGSLISIFFLISFIYIFIIKYARNQINSLNVNSQWLKKIAYIDHLTGAYNRQFLSIWDKEYRDKNKIYSIIMIDVDKFKDINDNYGHNKGDLVLKSISEIIISCSRKEDILFRFGGDEFLLFLSNGNPQAADQIMTRIKEQIKNLDILPNPISISYGISQYSDTNKLEFSINHADKLMYENKNS